ncbi:MAG: hypothetical protein LBS21_09165 [Clostridiales bacterium]|jgi:hypothetical protein|nr:hypothetical protein [Clostridiales bacterium]
MACIFGHKWNGCTCEKCGKLRDEQHKWNGCTCEKCGKTRNEQHKIENGKCVRCGKTIAEIITADLPAFNWTMSGNANARYYSAKAPSLCFAGEILSQLTNVPPMTYYMVDTPDGTLGRDIVGFFTEAPIKTKGLSTKYRTYGLTGAVSAESLMGYGDFVKMHSIAAATKMNGQYTKLVMMMKCGHCGYESPVETQAGDMERECYFCGTNNKTTRGGVSVFTAKGLVEL